MYFILLILCFSWAHGNQNARETVASHFHLVHIDEFEELERTYHDLVKELSSKECFQEDKLKKMVIRAEGLMNKLRLAKNNSSSHIDFQRIHQEDIAELKAIISDMQAIKENCMEKDSQAKKDNTLYHDPTGIKSMRATITTSAHFNAPPDLENAQPFGVERLVHPSELR